MCVDVVVSLSGMYKLTTLMCFGLYLDSFEFIVVYVNGRRYACLIVC